MPDNKTVTFDAPTRERLRALVIKHGGPTEDSGWCLNESGLDDLLREFLSAAPTPAAQSAGQEAARWRCVDDGLPEPETDVLVRKEFGAAIYHDIAGLFDGVWKSQVSQDDCKFRVTHWMPVPSLYAAPVNGGERGDGGDSERILREFGNFEHPDERAADAPQVGGDEREIFEGRLGRGKTYTERDFMMWLDGLQLGRARAALSADGGEAANLEGLREKLFDGRPVIRDADGWYWHPAIPNADEDVNYEKLLTALRVETTFVSMEADDPEAADRYGEAGEGDCHYWTPTPPEGDDWCLLSMYDTEDGPHALFGRDAHVAEQKRKPEHTRRTIDVSADKHADRESKSQDGCAN